MSGCNHDRYTNSFERCKNSGHGEGCVVRRCDQCGDENGHDFGSDGAGWITPQTSKTSAEKTVDKKFNKIVSDHQEADQAETDKKFHDIVSKIQFDEDK